MTRPWVKSWRPRPGSAFEQRVSSPAKCIFARLEKLVDDDGYALIADGDPIDALARLMGWPPGPSRRSFRRWVTELVDHGCLDLGPGTALLRNFDRWQGDRRSTEGRSKDRERSAEGQQKVEQSSTKGQSKVSQRSAEGLQKIELNPAESLGSGFSPIRSGEVDKREKRQEESDFVAPPAPSVAAQIGAIEAVLGRELCREARDSCALSRRTGEMADSVWLRTLRALEAFGAGHAQQAMRLFTEKHADGEKDERYLIGIARNESKRATNVRTRGQAPVQAHELFADEDPLEVLNREAS